MTSNIPIQPFGLSIAAAVAFTGGAISRTRIFELIKSGDLEARKVGRRTVVLTESLRGFLERQPKAGEASGGNPLRETAEAPASAPRLSHP